MMKILNNARRQAMVLMRGLDRAAASSKARVKARPAGSGLRARLRSGEEGQSLVEFALVMSMVLLPLMAFFFTLSMALDHRLQLDEGVSNGGRVLALQRGQTDPCAATITAIEAAAPGLTPASFSFTFVISGPGGGSYTTTCPTTTTVYMTSGDNAEVEVTYPYTLNIYGAPVAAGTFHSNITEVTQ
jgi:Flp pilus assembly protein TadG